MESHLVRIINRLEAMAKDGGNLKRNFEREGVVVAEVAYSHDEENGSIFTLRDVEARQLVRLDFPWDTDDGSDYDCLCSYAHQCSDYSCWNFRC